MNTVLDEYLSKYDNLEVVTHRGIKCINTFPSNIIWGIPNTVLECNNCISYAIDPNTNVLIGLCANCAEIYKGKYGCGYYGNLQGMTKNINPVTFGGLNTDDVIKKLSTFSNLDKSKIICLRQNDLYTIYNLVLLSNNDIELLCNKDNYGWKEFQNYYNCEDEALEIIIENIYKLKSELEKIRTENISDFLFDKEFYKKCIDVEDYFRVKHETEPIELPESNIKQCNYCRKESCKINDLKKCGNCKEVRYCSIACQTRDWKIKHKKICVQSRRNSIDEETAILNLIKIESDESDKSDKSDESNNEIDILD